MVTGVWRAPVAPPIAGRESYRGRVMHVSAYTGSADVTASCVLVVGLGHSGKDVALAAVEAGANTAVAVRDGVLFVDYPNVLSRHAAEPW